MLFMEQAFSQDPGFSQFYANPLYLNPALAGSGVCPRLILNYRNQWPSLSKGYVTYNGSYDQYIGAIAGGVGILFNADRAGGGHLNATSISAMYAYKFNITSKVAASAALEVGYYQRHIAWEKLTFEDMIDPQNGFVLPTSEKQPDNPTVGVPDFAFGFIFSHEKNFFGGVAVHHLTQPKIGFYSDTKSKLDMKITGHAGYTFDLRGSTYGDYGKEFSLSPNILYQQQGQFHQLNVGMYLNIEPIVFGCWYRMNFENSDAVIPMVGVHYLNLKAGYSYDATISRLKGSSGGAHEISFAWQFPCIEKRRHIKAIKCPKF